MARLTRWVTPVVPVATLVIGLSAGMIFTLAYLRTDAVAHLEPGHDARITDRRDRAAPVPRDGALSRGQRVQAGRRPARVRLAGGGNLSLAPGAILAFNAGPTADVRLESGVAIVETTTVVRELRIETPAGALVLTSARVEVRAGLQIPSAGQGGVSALAELNVSVGSVRLESAGRSLIIESGETGLMVAGRPPVRPDFSGGQAWSGRPVHSTSRFRPLDRGRRQRRRRRSWSPSRFQ